MTDREFDHVWFWKKRLPERKGQRCRVWARDLKRIGVEFKDGTKVTASRYAVRYAGPEPADVDWRDELPDATPEPMQGSLL